MTDMPADLFDRLYKLYQQLENYGSESEDTFAMLMDKLGSSEFARLLNTDKKRVAAYDFALAAEQLAELISSLGEKPVE